jgi:glucose dehydrogenase
MGRRWFGLGLLAVLGLAIVGILAVLTWGPKSGTDSARTAYAAPAVAKPATTAFEHVSGEWHVPAGDYASTRFSDLDEITTQNVGQLKPAFTFDTGFLKGHEAAPLIVGSTMYLATPYPNVVYALDLTMPDNPVKWRFDP